MKRYELRFGEFEIVGPDEQRMHRAVTAVGYYDDDYDREAIFKMMAERIEKKIKEEKRQ